MGVPNRPAAKHIVWSWVGGTIGIGLVALIAHLSGHPLLMAPLGASAVLAFGVPDSPLAQPRNIIGGHILTTIVGLVFLSAFGAGWWVAGLAVGASISVMQYTNTVHPPAGANPLVVLATGAGWDYVLLPVALSAAALTFVAVLFNNIAPSRKQYPTFWY
ncbi:MAG: HPP family protein [Kordiimonas sp.]